MLRAQEAKMLKHTSILLEKLCIVSKRVERRDAKLLGCED
jgi:hypothetical protein